VLGVPICTYIFGHVIQRKEAPTPFECPVDTGRDKAVSPAVAVDGPQS